MRKVLPVLVLLAILLTACSPKQPATLVKRNVFYAGPEGGVKTALVLAGYTLVDDPAQADVLVLNGSIPDPAALATRMHTGAGLVLVLSKDTSQADLQTLLGQPVTLKYAEDAVSLTNAKGAKDALLTEIVWNGAPQVRERVAVQGLGSPTLVSAYEDGEGVLWQLSANAYLLTASLTDGANPQIQEWGYFNYLVYHLVERAAGAQPLSFADYPVSPVPHAKDRNALFVFLGAELVFFYGAFVIVRRYSLKHPEALDTLVADKSKFEAQEEHTEWEKVGYHRPLSGLMVGMGIGIIMFIPLIIYQNLILPQFILPSAQALGMWGRVTQFFGLTWAVWDLGTAAASMKFLSQYRVSDPRRGFKYLQVYVWWQALSGAIQVALVVALTSTGLVRTPYALFAWSIVIHSMIQIPGFYQVMRNTLNALQRNDYARYIDAAWAIVLPILTQLALVPIFYAWGKAHPAIGASMGGVLGMGAAAYALELCSFMLALWLYRRIGYKASVIFMAHFDWSIIKETFRFGFFEMLGGTLVAAGGALEIWVTQNGLVNYSETWGNWILAGNFLVAFSVSTNLFDGVMPAISEALSHGYKKLCQYYSVQSYKWGAIASAALCAILLVVAPKFIIGSSGPEFQRAAVLAIPLSIFGSIQFLGWLGDAIFLGSNHPVLRASMVVVEQTIRIGLMIVLLAHFQIEALIIAYFIGILTRGIVAYFVADRTCFPQRFYFWQSLAAPILAAGLHYLFLSLIAKLVWKGDDISSIVLFFIGLLPAMPVFFFFYALVGGWDDAGLEEVAEASHLTGFLYRVVWVVFVLPSRWGARLSPLHNRFPITNRDEAMAEARALTEERVKLVHG
ncbi:MAG TPA: lipopolysaccharide biosynthesis protein [Anaerolineales bacterium]|nr:lipopolysaccharide biosynthesis protein [Anaerolineales bacterium]